MVRSKGKGAEREILSPAEKSALIEQRRELEATVKEHESYGKGTAAEQLDLGKVKQEIAYIDRAIAEREPPKLRGNDKDKMLKEAESIEDQLRQGMPTREEMRFPGKNPGAVRKHMGWIKRNQELIERYRTIQKTVNPHDPRSVENLRRDK